MTEVFVEQPMALPGSANKMVVLMAFCSKNKNDPCQLSPNHLIIPQDSPSSLYSLWKELSRPQEEEPSPCQVLGDVNLYNASNKL